MRIFKLMLIIVLLFLPCVTWAVKNPGTPGVANGVHNLSTTGVDPWDGGSGGAGSSLYATDEEAICVFCHTPHGGSLSAPLWNRNAPAPAGGWSHYNSASMSIDAGLSVGRLPNPESLICLSCHDGSISVNHLINLPNTRGGVAIKTWNGEEATEIIDDIIFGTPGKRIGGSLTQTNDTGDLSDDHPISFSYEQVITSTEYTSGTKIGGLKAADVASNNGVEFFGGAARNVECSSCHDPHVDYISDPDYTPFLIMPNAGSELCLACHNK